MGSPIQVVRDCRRARALREERALRALLKKKGLRVTALEIRNAASAGPILPRRVAAPPATILLGGREESYRCPAPSPREELPRRCLPGEKKGLCAGQGFEKKKKASPPAATSKKAASALPNLPGGEKAASSAAAWKKKGLQRRHPPQKKVPPPPPLPGRRKRLQPPALRESCLAPPPGEKKGLRPPPPPEKSCLATAFPAERRKRLRLERRKRPQRALAAPAPPERKSGLRTERRKRLRCSPREREESGLKASPPLLGRTPATPPLPRDRSKRHKTSIPSRGQKQSGHDTAPQRRLGREETALATARSLPALQRLGIEESVLSLPEKLVSR
uniref:Uncharacterized protein n=1 Tax=Sphaerodactylus townsendi TaxID=933632 RepID=A0ACB8FJA8_9SAUR